MGLLASLERRAQPALDDDRYYEDYYTSKDGLTTVFAPSWAGVRVNESTALTVSAAWACIRLFSEVIGSLPIKTYQRNDKDDSKSLYRKHPLYRLLHDRPNPYMNAATFKECLQMHCETWGNCYAEIERDTQGNPLALWPLRPDRMTPEWDTDGSLVYFYRLPEGKTVKMPAYRIFHVPCFTWDGKIGLSPIAAAREELGMAIAMQRFGGSFFRNGATPQGVITHPKTLTPKAMTNLQESWYEQHGGLTRAQRIAILEEGADYKQIGIPPEDAQFLGSRQFELEDIARFWRVPPHLIGHLTRSTYNNIEHQGIEFVVYSIRIRTVRWEQEIQTKLVSAEDQDSVFAEYLIDALLRGDWKSRSESLEIMRRNAVINGNDWCRIENLNPIGPVGDIYTLPMNYVQLKSDGSVSGFAGEEKNKFTAGASGPTSKRAKGSPVVRNRLRAAYSGLILQTADRAVRRETTDVRKLIKKHLVEKHDLDGFEEAITKFYRDHTEYLQKNFGPLFRSYAEAITAAVAEEIGGDPAMTPELETFAARYTDSFVKRTTQSSKNQIRKIIREAPAGEAQRREAIDEELEQRLEEWEEREPAKVTDEETVRASDAFARQAFIAGGVTELVWVTQGPKACPYCLNLDGTTVGIEKEFVPSGDFTPEDGVAPMRVYGAKSHPPLHEGCACTIVSA